MGYNKTKAKTVYQPMRSTAISPVSHEAFRREWEANFDAAVEKARQLEKQGFLVEEGLQRGALMESKAKQLAESLKQRGYEVELVPVARWGKEQVVFLIYKPPEKPVEPPTPSKKPPNLIPADKIIDNFAKTFGVEPGVSPFFVFANEGIVMDKAHMVGVVDIEFKPQPGVESSKVLVCQRGKKAKTAGLKLAQFYNDSKLRATLLELERLRHKWVSPDSKKEFPIPINFFRKVLRVVGDGPVTAYAPDSDGPIYFFNERAPSNIAVACVKDYNATTFDTDTMDYVIDIAKSNFGYQPPQI
jgi:hypothetical protein